MSFLARPHFDWKLRTQSLALGKRTLVMGVVNMTPDSFSDGGRYRTHAEAAESALAMFEDGVAIVDVGGESTRPGKHEPVSAAEEISRVLPVIEAVRKYRPNAILSVDTYKAATAQTALEAGAEIVNDVSGFLWDHQLAGFCAAAACGVVLVHTRGRPQEWRTLPKLATGQIVPLVKRELQERLQMAVSAGISPEHIVLDPGFGFGKLLEANYTLLAGLAEFRTLGRPLLAGLSRKTFLGKALESLHRKSPVPADERSHASLAAATAAILAGAHLVRAHEVRPTVEAAAVADAVLAAGESERR